jgi:hypothetical protein
MNTLANLRPEEDENEMTDSAEMSEKNDAVEDDGTPVLDEQDLEETGLDEEEAEDVEWEEPESGGNS